MQETCKVEVAANEAKMQEWYAGLRENARSRKQVGERGMQAIAAPEATPRKIEVVTATAPLTLSGKPLRKKPQQFADLWCKKGIKFEDYKEGKNPFTDCGNKFAAVAMDLFLNGGKDGVKGMASKDDLIYTFMDKLNWQIGTASSHANIVIDAFEYLGIISVHEPRGYLVKYD